MSELIAEARVLVTPDTTKFPGLLQAEVAAAIKSLPPQTVPITPVLTTAGTGAVTATQTAQITAGAKAATQANAQVAASTKGAAAGARAASAANTQLGSSAVAAAKAQSLQARAADVVATAEKRAALATTDVSAAQTRYRAQLSATALTFKAYQATLGQGDFLLTKQARDAFAAAKANEALALSNLEVAKTADAEAKGLAKAAAAQSASLGGVAKGGSSAAASLLGVRGATLAATGPFIAGAAGAIAFTKAIQTFTGFNQELSVFAATTGATADEITRVSDSAKQLGKDITLPAASAQDAAEAMTEFAKAGLSVEDSIKAARGGLQLATAAQLSNADAVEITANALNAFKLSGDQAVSVADTLANAANAAQGSIADVGLGLKQAAGAAAVVGVSFKDTTALLTLLAKNGLTASDAGTSLRTAFIRLVNPSKQAKEILKDLNINLRDAQGNLRPEVFAEFAQAQQGLARSTQDANAAIVFGQDAFRAFGVLSREGTTGLNDTRKALDQQGTAAKIAGARMVGLAGDVENLKNELSALGIQAGALGSALAGPLVRGTTHFVQSLEKIGNKIGNFVDPKGFDAAAHGFDSLAEHADKLQRALIVDPDPFFSPQLTKELGATLDELTAKSKELVRQGFLTRFIQTFVQISPDVKKAMQDNIITPAEEAQLQATGIGRAFLDALPHTSEFFKDFGLSAQDGIEAAKVALGNSGPALAKALQLGLEDAGAKAKADAARVGKDIGDTLNDSIAASASRIQDLLANAFTVKRTRARQAAGKAASDLIDIQFQGGSLQQQVAGFKKLLQDQNDLVDALVGDPNAKQSKIDQAKQDAIDTQGKIDGLVDQINAPAIAAAAKAKSDAEARQRANEAAAKALKAANDASFLNAQDDARGRQERLVGLADETASTADDIRTRQALRALDTKQIAAIRASALDADAKKQAIKDLAKERQATTDEINRLVITDREQKQAQKQEAAEALASARLELAQTTFDLTGAKAPLERALDAEIKRQIGIKNAAKKGSLAFIQAQTAIRGLLKQKKDLNDEVKDAAKEQGLTGGTSLVDLFNENQRIFDQIGNVGQSAAGLTTHAQNASISAIVQHQIQFGGSPAATAQQKATDALTRAIVELTNKLGGQGNFSLGVPAPGTGPVIGRSQALAEEQRFFYQKQAKAMVEQGLG